VSAAEERIKQMIERKKQEEATAQGKAAAAEEAEAARQKTVAERRKKWADDTHIIDALVRDIEKLAAVGLSLQLKFQHTPGNPGTTIGMARFSGTSPKTMNGQMTWNVHEDGTIRVFHGKGATQEVTAFALDDADEKVYEKHILDFVDAIV
jgi:hypothetical protein